MADRNWLLRRFCVWEHLEISRNVQRWSISMRQNTYMYMNMNALLQQHIHCLFGFFVWSIIFASDERFCLLLQRYLLFESYYKCNISRIFQNQTVNTQTLSIYYQKMALDFAATYKVLVLGDSNVGKTCIVHRYCDERYYDTYISTIGKLKQMIRKVQWVEKYNLMIFVLKSRKQVSILSKNS